MKYSYFLLFFLSFQSFCSVTDGIDRLMEGNQRFIDGKLIHPNRTEERRKATSTGQEPFAIVVSCSDSRVSPEIIFDEGVGDLFVVRLAGNVIDPIAKESIDFAVNALHASTILVLGHENCGAVNAVLQKQDQSIPKIAALISPSFRNKNKNLEEAIKANAIHMNAKLMKYKNLKKLILEKKLATYAGYYNLKTGKVELLHKKEFLKK